MSDTLATINVDQLNNAVSRAVSLSKLADLSSTVSKITSHKGSTSESVTTTTLTRISPKGHVFVKPANNSAKRKRQASAAMSGDVTLPPNNVSTVHVSTIKPNPLTGTKGNKKDSAAKQQPVGTASSSSSSISTATSVVAILPQTSNVNSNCQTTIHLPVLQTLAPATKIINAYIPSPTNSPVLSPISVDGKNVHFTQQPHTSISGLSQLSQIISTPLQNQLSAPQDLLAAATQATIPHLITRYPKSQEGGDESIANNNVVKVVSTQPIPLCTNQNAQSQAITVASGPALSVPVAGQQRAAPTQQPLTIYQIVSSPTATNTSASVVNAVRDISVGDVQTIDANAACIVKAGDSSGVSPQNSGKTVYHLLLSNPGCADITPRDYQISGHDLQISTPNEQPSIHDGMQHIEVSGKEAGPEVEESEGDLGALFTGQFCIDCDPIEVDSCNPCPHHPSASCIADTEILSRARMSIPHVLEIREDAKQKHGVFAKEIIPGRTRFGPLVGVEIPEKEAGNISSDTCYIWKIYKTKEEFVYLDCTDENETNWMRFARTAPTSAEQSLTAFQENGHIYFITRRDIAPGTELLFWYSSGYSKVIGKNVRPEDRFKCGFCKKPFEDMYSVSQHIRYSHPDTTKRKWKCSVCHRAFASAAKLNTHNMCHVGLKPHRCNECGKSFTDQSNLRIHMIIHSGERNFICNICNRAFRQKAHLKSHMLTHTGEKRMQCQYCHKLFARRSDVRVHELQHTKETVFKCFYPECKKEFYKLQSFNKHLLVHSGIREHQCDQCKKSFVTKYHLKRHSKSCQLVGQPTSDLPSGETSGDSAIDRGDNHPTPEATSDRQVE